ncbi:hypothetical protein BOTBODRAFT_251867 [Botryobasidium botryosum FD-172 SS1]|uniref:Zn(2)-C6 fungal-type domain-containing protein n=1 Tax=Botryobasidium botryosum (strain FD-172 SS1) TaxID=930990 RepID=A0A067MLW5_BOTB1|nr:hypothetical protein BOTBODRAFT_251867 [Botryobasidium botryosum FD-172 SS1]
MVKYDKKCEACERRSDGDCIGLMDHACDPCKTHRTSCDYPSQASGEDQIGAESWRPLYTEEEYRLLESADGRGAGERMATKSRRVRKQVHRRPDEQKMPIGERCIFCTKRGHDCWRNPNNDKACAWCRTRRKKCWSSELEMAKAAATKRKEMSDTEASAQAERSERARRRRVAIGERERATLQAREDSDMEERNADATTHVGEVEEDVDAANFPGESAAPDGSEQTTGMEVSPRVQRATTHSNASDDEMDIQVRQEIDAEEIATPEMEEIAEVTVWMTEPEMHVDAADDGRPSEKGKEKEGTDASVPPIEDPNDDARGTSETLVPEEQIGEASGSGSPAPPLGKLDFPPMPATAPSVVQEFLCLQSEIYQLQEGQRRDAARLAALEGRLTHLAIEPRVNQWMRDIAQLYQNLEKGKEN